MTPHNSSFLNKKVGICSSSKALGTNALGDIFVLNCIRSTTHANERALLNYKPLKLFILLFVQKVLSGQTAVPRV